MMIEKQNGKINEIVYEYTVLSNQYNIRYLTTSNLIFLINKIIEANDTCEYLRFTPFYRNFKFENMQIEFEEYMFYMECRTKFTANDLEEHIEECLEIIFDVPNAKELNKKYYEEHPQEKEFGKFLYPLCLKDDTEMFKDNLNNYKDFLKTLMPFLVQKVIDLKQINLEDVAVGEFIFEVHSE